jgi:hypothetical protein
MTSWNNTYWIEVICIIFVATSCFTGTSNWLWHRDRLRRYPSLHTHEAIRYRSHVISSSANNTIAVSWTRLFFSHPVRHTNLLIHSKFLEAPAGSWSSESNGRFLNWLYRQRMLICLVCTRCCLSLWVKRRYRIAFGVRRRVIMWWIKRISTVLLLIMHDWVDYSDP